MNSQLRLLVVEDIATEAMLAVRQIEKTGLTCTWRRVETERELREALRDFAPELIISDFTLPQFDGLSALAVAVAEAPNVPFIFVSGTIGEERAIEALRQGAADYVLKTNPARLGPAVRRALDDAAARESRRLAEKQIRKLTYFDPLTGLAKRTLFCERLDRYLKTRDATIDQAVVVVFDVERLSVINDSLGRVKGDLLLQGIADRLRQHFRDSDYLGHIDGGTFAALLTHVDTSDPALHSLHTQIVATFGWPVAVGGQEIPIFVRCGLAPLPSVGGDAEQLLQNAEAALHQAKTSGVRYLQHRPEMRSEVAERFALEYRLRAAVERDQFRLYYQPQVERCTGRIAGVEALLRWVDPERGLVPPAVFLQVLESTKLIIPIGEWVLKRAAEDCQRWRRLGFAPLHVAVNVSPVQLNRRDFGPRFLELTHFREWPACGLDIEVTEEAMLQDVDSSTRALQALRNEGVRIAIDDFGTGYSSLGRLAELPVDMLKIDRSFTSKLTSHQPSQAVITTIITLAQSLGLETIAEGVETIEQLEILEALGCGQSQGYVHSALVMADQLELLLMSDLRSVG